MSDMQRGALVFILGLALTGCESSGRFSDFGGGRQAVAPPRVQTFTPAPTGRVETSSLPPVASNLPPASPNPELDDLPPRGPGGPSDPPGLPTAAGPPTIGSDPRQQRPPEPAISEPRQAEPPARVASRPDFGPPPGPAGPTRTGVTGNWTAREASGGACKVTLSSAPTLDLYKASTSGCQSRELQRISAWELRGDEVYLYEPGGGVAARLKQSGRNFEGAASKTGAPITLSK